MVFPGVVVVFLVDAMRLAGLPQAATGVDTGLECEAAARSVLDNDRPAVAEEPLLVAGVPDCLEGLAVCPPADNGETFEGVR